KSKEDGRCLLQDDQDDIGVEGTSGDHRSRKTLLELHLMNAALDAIKQRYNFLGFHLVGQSGGSKLVGAHKSRQPLVDSAGNAIEHLVDHAVDAAVADMLHRNTGGLRIRQREAAIVEALIAEMRAGVIPRADAVSAGKPAGVPALIGKVACVSD